MAKLSRNNLLLIAVALSALFAFSLYRYLNTPVESENVIVAAVDISPRTMITAEMVKEVAVPKNYIQANALRDKKKVVGSVVRESIISGEQITARRLTAVGKSMGLPGVIPKDKRAMTILVNEETGVAGFPKPGDYVDVVVTFEEKELGEPVSQIILQNLQVLATNQEMENIDNQVASNAKAATAANKTNTITLAVNPLEAAQLALSDEKGKVRLALRPFLAFDDFTRVTSVTPTSVIKSTIKPLSPSNPAPQIETVASGGGYGANNESSNVSAEKDRTIQLIRGTKSETLFLN